jgi:3-dehydroquinate synthase
MASDKKSVGGKLRLVLLRGIGEAVLTADFDYNALESVLNGFNRGSRADT